jgi:hypothetical protein
LDQSASGAADPVTEDDLWDDFEELGRGLPIEELAIAFSYPVSFSDTIETVGDSVMISREGCLRIMTIDLHPGAPIYVRIKSVDSGAASSIRSIQSGRVTRLRLFGRHGRPLRPGNYLLTLRVQKQDLRLFVRLCAFNPSMVMEELPE